LEKSILNKEKNKNDLFKLENKKKKNSDIKKYNKKKKNIKRNDKNINKEKDDNGNDTKNDKKQLYKMNYSHDITITNSLNSNDKISNISQFKFNQTESKSSLFLKDSINSLSLKYSKINNLNEDIEKKANISKINKNNISTSTSIIHNINFEIIADNDNNKNIKKTEKKDEFLKIINRKPPFIIQRRSLTITRDSKESIKVNRSICFKELDSNNSNVSNDSNNSSHIKYKTKSSLPKNEDIYYNAFINLNSTQENSLQFNSSYENINQISNNKYIDNILLQFKTKQFIIRQCTEEINNNYPQLHHSPTQKQNIKIYEKYNLNKNDIDDKLKKEDKIKYSNSLKKLVTKKSNNIDKVGKNGNKIIKRGSAILITNHKLEKKLSRFDSFSKILKTRNSCNINIQKRVKRKYTKKKLIQVYKKLDTISKNIENANNAINNPNEFYMNFFNNIIKNETCDNDIIKEELKKEKASNTLVSLNN
jgi:hypothetical protein